MLELRPATSATEWRRARSIRQQVFVEGQACPPGDEWDGLDPVARHLLALVDGIAVGTARWRSVPKGDRLAAKLERFAILAPHRGLGYGRELVVGLLDDARRHGLNLFLLHAQAHLVDFYRSLGFEACGPGFTEAGIPHLPMERDEAGG